MEQVIHDFMKDDEAIRRIVHGAQDRHARELTERLSGNDSPRGNGGFETRTERRARERKEAKAAKRQKVAA